MSTHIKQNNCPCSKGEYCTNGLKCTERNCFLLKSSTFITKSPASSIENLNPLKMILPPDYREDQLFYSFKHKRFERPHEMASMERFKKNNLA